MRLFCKGKTSSALMNIEQWTSTGVAIAVVFIVIIMNCDCNKKHCQHRPFSWWDDECCLIWLSDDLPMGLFAGIQKCLCLGVSNKKVNYLQKPPKDTESPFGSMSSLEEKRKPLDLSCFIHLNWSKSAPSPTQTLNTKRSTPWIPIGPFSGPSPLACFPWLKKQTLRHTWELLICSNCP